MATTQSRSTTKDELLSKKKQFLMPCYFTFYREPLWIDRAWMQYIYDEKGRKYLDCFSGVGVVNCGHGNPAIIEAASARALTLDHTTSIYLNEPMIRLAERLANVTPGGLGKTFFCSSGSEANETGALLAMLSTGRGKFIAFDAALHGRTLLTMNLTGLAMWQTDDSLAERVLRLPTPNCHRCPFGKAYPSCSLHCAREAGEQIVRSGPDQYAAFFCEPILGNGGIIPMPEGYLELLGETLTEYGIPMIVDEMQTGFGRTGRWFGIEHHSVEPEIMTMAKALGNGVPVGATICTDKIAASYSKPGASTFGGNGMSMGAALATLDWIESERLIQKAETLGAFLADGLRALAERFGCISDVRGRGLMLGAEIVEADGIEDPERTDAILEKMKDRGFVLGKTGERRNVLTFMPPLVVEQRDLEELLKNLILVLARVESGE